jgi:transposase
LIMRGDDQQQSELFLYGSLEQRIPQDHPLRPVREMTDAALESMSRRFDQMYAKCGRPFDCAGETAARAAVAGALFHPQRAHAGRAARIQLEYNLLFRWFVGLAMGEPTWNHAVFSKNRERLLAGDVAQELFTCVVEQARALRLLSDEHFTVDGTLIEAWASHKSFRAKQGGDGGAAAEGGFSRGEKRHNETHQSRTDPEAKFISQESRTGVAAGLSGARDDGQPARSGGGHRAHRGAWAC